MSTEDLTYQRLSFEDDLFNGMVYKRNFINYMLRDSSKSKPHQGAISLNAKATTKTMSTKGKQQTVNDIDSTLRVQNVSKQDTASLKKLERIGSFSPEVIRRATNIASNPDPQSIPSREATPSVVCGKEKGKRSEEDSEKEQNHLLDILHAFPSPSSAEPILVSREGAREHVEVQNQVSRQGSHASPDSLARLARRTHNERESEHRSSAEACNGRSVRQWNDQAFLDACKKGDMVTLEALLKDEHELYVRLKSPADPNTEAIHIANKYGDSNVVRPLLHHRAALEAEITSLGSRPLHLAAESGNLLLTKLLLQRGACVSPKNYDGDQPIHLASKTGVLEVLGVLMEAGAAIDAQNDHDLRPLDIAAGALDQPDVIHFLARKGAQIDASVRHDINRLLHSACRLGLVGNVRAILDLYPLLSTEGCTSENICPLSSAIKWGSSAAVEALLQRGISPTPSHRRGFTSLHNIVSNWKADPFSDTVRRRQLEVLLKHKPNPNVQDENGDTPLHLLASLPPAIRPTTVLDMAYLLLSHQAKPDLPNRSGETPLFLAIHGTMLN